VHLKYNDLRVGDKVSIRYLPRDPDYSRMEEKAKK
jgi:hypothetical protein